MRFSLLLGLTLSLASCKKPAPTVVAPPSSPVETTANAPQPKIEACSLITKEEVKAIQGTDIVDTKGSEGPSGSFLVSQCYYASGEANKSVSLSVTQTDPRNTGGTTPSKFWEQTFGPYRSDKPETEQEKEKAEEAKEKKGSARSGEEEKEKARPPTKITGVGQEAFWAGNRFGGVLYILKGEVILRISVGGADNEETKINKSKALARKAIERL